ncbi:hypothetical protein [Streptomyces sp. NPDC014006]|uniref:hypothetical protein n=1 Tax=Streptomyces sp. NPDC014006 TaxID=3364870 RepID=UPI0036F9C847
MSFARHRTAKALAATLLASCAALAVTATTTEGTGSHPATRTQALGSTTGWQSPTPATVEDTTGRQ